MKRIIYVLLILLVGFGCVDSEDLDSPTNGETAEKSVLIPMDISHAGLPLIAMVVPKEGYQIEAKWNDTFGRLELQDTEGMDLFIQEIDLSCDEKKKEIESGIFNVEYVFENDSILCYTTSLPDGTPAYSHLFGSILIGESNYTFENNPLVECSPVQITHMKSVIENIQFSKVHYP